MDARSKAIFKVSRSGTPSKKERCKGKVTADKLNVRSWAGRDSPTVSFSPLCIKDVVSVCDAILSDSGDTWYYIRYNGKYGFVNATLGNRIMRVETVPLFIMSIVNYEYME